MRTVETAEKKPSSSAGSAAEIAEAAEILEKSSSVSTLLKSEWESDDHADLEDNKTLASGLRKSHIRKTLHSTACMAVYIMVTIEIVGQIR